MVWGEGLRRKAERGSDGSAHSAQAPDNYRPTSLGWMEVSSVTVACNPEAAPAEMTQGKGLFVISKQPKDLFTLNI